ncbi:MAG TPA: hypothetical protein PLZ51_01750 [Aggregatilineales bacterium]|nr:hypothetical protein [Aggregatilineales bacterium]
MNVIKVKSELSHHKKQVLQAIQKLPSHTKFNVTAIVSAGNRWGEKRVFEYLKAHAGNTPLFLEAGTLGEIRVKEALMPLFKMMNMSLTDNEFVQLAINKIYDLEDETSDFMATANTGQDKGGLSFSAFEAYTIYNPSSKLYGIEDKDLYNYQYQLAQTGKIDDLYYEVARLRSETMFYNMLDIMLNNGNQAAIIGISGFHGKLFRELSSEFHVNYIDKIVTTLDKAPSR